MSQTYVPIQNVEIQDGAPADLALFNKVKGNFDNHEMRLVNEELDVDLVRAYQIVIDDLAGIYNAGNIEAALEEVMQLVNSNQIYNVNLLSDHAPRITDLESRATLIETNIDTIESAADTLTSRVISTETVNTTQDTQISSLIARMNTAESNITSVTNTANLNTTQISRITTSRSMSYASVDKSLFLLSLVNNGGTAPSFVTGVPNITGTGLINATAASQELTYDVFIPVNALIGTGMSLTYSAPIGAVMSFGFKCFDHSQVALSNKLIITNQSGTGSFVLAQGHLKGEGLLADNFPAGTRFVKPYITWTSNTGTINIDFLNVEKLGLSQYSLYID
jgi:hypothetical protein